MLDDLPSNIHYRQKIWNIFYFSDFMHFCGVCRVFLYLKYFLTSRRYFWRSWLALNYKMNRKGSKTIISVFFSIRLWWELFLSLCQFAAISIHVLYSDIVHNTIVYLPPILVRSAGISVVGASHRSTPGVVLVYHKVKHTKALPITNNRSFHIE